MFRTFLQACLLGLSVAAPVGPIGVLCIRRTLSDGRALGFACGLGAATADAFYALLAGIGSTAASSLLLDHVKWVRLVGAAWLLVLGVQAMRAEPAEKGKEIASRSMIGAWLATLFLTLANPTTILSFAAMFSALAFGAQAPTPALVSGVFVGSVAWWLILSGSVGALRTRITRAHLRWVNRASGAILVGFAVWAVAGLFRAKA
jgi:threonine/homoserine/homoserine lactone efflux protein